jgi:hypothetical protein
VTPPLAKRGPAAAQIRLRTRRRAAFPPLIAGQYPSQTSGTTRSHQPSGHTLPPAHSSNPHSLPIGCCSRSAQNPRFRASTLSGRLPACVDGSAMAGIRKPVRKRKSHYFQVNPAFTPKADENLRVQKPRRSGAIDPEPTCRGGGHSHQVPILHPWNCPRKLPLIAQAPCRSDTEPAAHFPKPSHPAASRAVCTPRTPATPAVPCRDTRRQN